MLRFHEKRPKKRVKFSEEEDELLKDIILHGGTNNWVTIAAMMPNRNVRQCKERWMYHILPALPKKQWEEEEDNILIEKYKEFGNRWFKITPYLKERSQKMVKDRIRVLIRNGIVKEQKKVNTTKKNVEISQENSQEKHNEDEVFPTSDFIGSNDLFDVDTSFSFMHNHIPIIPYDEEKKDSSVEILSSGFDPLPGDHQDWDKDGPGELFLE